MLDNMVHAIASLIVLTGFIPGIWHASDEKHEEATFWLIIALIGGMLHTVNWLYGVIL